MDVPDDETQPELRVVVDFGLRLDELRTDNVSCFSKSTECQYCIFLFVFAKAFHLPLRQTRSAENHDSPTQYATNMVAEVKLFFVCPATLLIPTVMIRLTTAPNVPVMVYPTTGAAA